jgi:hypothetical protein
MLMKMEKSNPKIPLIRSALPINDSPLTSLTGEFINPGFPDLNTGGGRQFGLASNVSNSRIPFLAFSISAFEAAR